MSKVQLLTWLPTFIGLALVAVTQIDLYQFHDQAIDVRSMLSRELPIVLVGLLFSLGVLCSSIYWLYKRKWLLASQAIVSPLIFLVCFGIGGALGGAYLNAT
jgi:uncharacterized BrkB/YihY/UPF0761 family membrane protein